MKGLLGFLIVATVSISTGYSQNNIGKIPDSALPAKVKEYSKFDFLEDPRKLSYWSGPISSFISGGAIKSIPLVSYTDSTAGISRIIFYSKNGSSTWENHIAGKGENFKNSEVKKITSDKQLQRQYNIYAFFINLEHLKKESDLNKIVLVPDFPCPVYVYKKNDDKWLLLKKVDVNNWNSYADLQFITVTTGNE